MTGAWNYSAMQQTFPNNLGLCIGALDTPPEMALANLGSFFQEM